MSLDLKITDMSGASPDHSAVITNFVNMVYNQLKDSTCRVYPDNVQYRWKMADGSEKTVIPDASINCHIRSRKGNSFINAPQFVLEVLSPSTAKYDRTGKMEIYRSEEIPEYWIVSPKGKSVEIYYLKDGKYELEQDYILEDDKEDEHYNAETVIALRGFPNIKMELKDIFEELD